MDIRRSRAAGSRAVARRSRLICSSARLFSASSLLAPLWPLPSVPDCCNWFRRAARRAASSGSAMGLCCCVRGDRGTELDHEIRAWEKRPSSPRCVAASCLSVSFTFTISAVTSAAFTMSSVKLHSSLHSSVAHAGASLQAKSYVLTGVQDAYWSDEEVRS